jgi:hypothetical protein
MNNSRVHTQSFIRFSVATIIHSVKTNSSENISVSSVLEWNMFRRRSALFWDITQHHEVILYRRFGTTYRSHFQGSRSLVFDPVPIRCPEKLAKDYHLKLRNNPEDRISQQHRGRSLKSKIWRSLALRPLMHQSLRFTQKEARGWSLCFLFI